MDTTFHWNPLGDEIETYDIEVSVAGRTDTLSRVVQLELLSVSDSIATAIGMHVTADEADRVLLVVRERGVTRFPVPPDVYSNYHDLAISPDGRHLAYVATHMKPYGLTAVVYDLDADSAVFRSRVTAKCDCDVDLNHAIWRTADSVDLAVDDSNGPDRGWLVASVRLRPLSVTTRVVQTEPNWHVLR